eukprot:TRINITY_DN51177_c0_g1_i1.p1 TRINITY_DN51177_c0_g1~~TRINITY_DN51177_c0_g1_i1.p1  ORF type:complete len:401 (+),score=91.81 TRINITY_DN51177_c0_g1_i1:53-1204(+)
MPQPRAQRGHYNDVPCVHKEKVNRRLAELHGRHAGLAQHGHALYLDGSALRTTDVLVEHGWPPELLHIPNCEETDFANMKRTSRKYGSGGPHLYPTTSTDLLRELATAAWVKDFRKTHSRGPFSLVYLDYTRVTSRAADLKLLLEGGLMTRGVLCITCPARAPHVAEGVDRHVQDEAEVPLVIGDDTVDLESDFRGLAKVCVEAQRACAAAAAKGVRIAAQAVGALTYVGKKTKMWVAMFCITPDMSHVTADWFEIGNLHGGFESHLGGCHPAAQRELNQAQSLWMCFRPGLPPSFNLSNNLEKIAREGGGSEYWAALLAFDWKQREAKRQWDFLVAMYGESQADNVPHIHADDRAAFRVWMQDYDVWACRYTGDIEAVWAEM